MTSEALRLKLLGVGAMSSPRYAPAGLLVLHSAGNVMLDGGPGAEPEPPSAAWLVTDLRAELIAQIRRLARARGLEPAVRTYQADGLVIVPHPVAHTNHPTWGYLMSWRGRLAAWAPEFSEFPAWASGVDLMFADAAGWRRPIRFRGGVGGHAAVLDTAERARQQGVRRLVLAHIGRATIRALETGEPLPYGEVGRQGSEYIL
jgi:Beta-lactamase superfamily domain